MKVLNFDNTKLDTCLKLKRKIVLIPDIACIYIVGHNSKNKFSCKHNRCTCCYVSNYVGIMMKKYEKEEMIFDELIRKSKIMSNMRM